MIVAAVAPFVFTKRRPRLILVVPTGSAQSILRPPVHQPHTPKPTTDDDGGAEERGQGGQLPALLVLPVLRDHPPGLDMGLPAVYQNFLARRRLGWAVTRRRSPLPSLLSFPPLHPSLGGCRPPVFGMGLFPGTARPFCLDPIVATNAFQTDRRAPASRGHPFVTGCMKTVRQCCRGPPHARGTGIEASGQSHTHSARGCQPGGRGHMPAPRVKMWCTFKGGGGGRGQIRGGNARAERGRARVGAVHESIQQGGFQRRE